MRIPGSRLAEALPLRLGRQPLRQSRADTGDAGGDQHGRRDAEVRHGPWQQKRAETRPNTAHCRPESRSEPADLGWEDFGRVDASQCGVHRVEEGEGEEQDQDDQRRRVRPQPNDREQRGAQPLRRDGKHAACRPCRSTGP